MYHEHGLAIRNWPRLGQHGASEPKRIMGPFSHYLCYMNDKFYDIFNILDF